MEPVIAESCQNLLRRLDEDDQEIATKLARIAKDEVCIKKVPNVQIC